MRQFYIHGPYDLMKLHQSKLTEIDGPKRSFWYCAGQEYPCKKRLRTIALHPFSHGLNTFGTYVAPECNTVRPKLLVDTAFICISVTTSA